MKIFNNKLRDNFAKLDRGWVIANHKLVSFHAAFLTSLFNISMVESRWDVLKQIFFSVELFFSLIIWYLAWHVNIAIHEMGHYLTAVKTRNLREDLAIEADRHFTQTFYNRFKWYISMFIRIPWGLFPGVSKEAGSFFPSVKAQNLAVSAAGPRASKNLSIASLPLGIILIIIGLFVGKMFNSENIVFEGLIYIGRFFFTIGVVALLDFFLSDPGKYVAFEKRQKEAKDKSDTVKATKAKSGSFKWSNVEPHEIKEKLKIHRLQEEKLQGGDQVNAPWEFRNSIMGGRHTEEMGGNLSFQEFMFLPLTAKDYIEAQRMTNALQNRVIEIVQDMEGLNFVGIGLEGGVVASFSRRKDDLLPEERALKVAVQSIEECGFIPDKDVCLALDLAASELSKAYREQTGKSDAIGQYLFWRAEEQNVMTSDELLELYKKWVKEYPIISLEDPFAEDDHEAWIKLMKELGKEILVIGDDLVTTKDTSIIKLAKAGLINAVLIKANQIGTLSETLLATKAAKDCGLELIVSHRSKSPNEVMEADIGFAVGALGLKCGGGSNTERLVKYGRIVELMELAKKGVKIKKTLDPNLEILDISAYEEPTNAGIPSVGIVLRLENGIRFTAATPLGTSAGEDEAIHLVDSIIEKSTLTEKYPKYFRYNTKEEHYKFAKDITDEDIGKEANSELAKLWIRAKRYNGKGCLNAVENIEKIIAPLFIGKKLSDIRGMVDVDKQLLEIELNLAIKRGKIAKTASAEDKINVMQRKANLGMNAILTVSLALARLVAAKEGKELPDILRKEEARIDRNHLYGV